MPNQPPVTNISDPRWLRAISHPIRIRLLSMLDEEPSSPVILAAKLDQPLGTIAYHVRTLYDLGLLKLVSTRQRRGATEHYYETTAHPRSTPEAWDAMDGVSKQRVLTALLDRANQLATRSAAAGGFDGDDIHCTSTSLKLDRQAMAELVGDVQELLGKIDRLEAESAERIKKDPDSKLDVGVTMMVFEATPFSADIPNADVVDSGADSDADASTDAAKSEAVPVA
jgi:DNA-binding transcriptional ArsR family regulator